MPGAGSVGGMAWAWGFDQQRATGGHGSVEGLASSSRAARCRAAGCRQSGWAEAMQTAECRERLPAACERRRLARPHLALELSLALRLERRNLPLRLVLCLLQPVRLGCRARGAVMQARGWVQRRRSVRAGGSSSTGCKGDAGSGKQDRLGRSSHTGRQKPRHTASSTHPCGPASLSPAPPAPPPAAAGCRPGPPAPPWRPLLLLPRVWRCRLSLGAGRAAVRRPAEGGRLVFAGRSPPDGAQA